jgi:hypothetical protein
MPLALNDDELAAVNRRPRRHGLDLGGRLSSDNLQLIGFETFQA